MNEVIEQGIRFATNESIRTADLGAQATEALVFAAMQAPVAGTEVLTGFDWVMLGREVRRVANDQRYRN